MIEGEGRLHRGFVSGQGLEPDHCQCRITSSVLTDANATEHIIIYLIFFPHKAKIQGLYWLALVAVCLGESGNEG